VAGRLGICLLLIASISEATRHVTTCHYAAPLLVQRKSGLIVEIVEQESIGYHGQFYFDLFEISLKRLAFALASELAPHGVTALSIAPGFMRTEAILEQFGVTNPERST